jgi:GT2 family glycosyltransferase
MDLVAVVLNWCAAEDSARAIRSIEAQGEDRVTILVVDNASPDGSGARLAARFPHWPHLQTDANLGYAGGNQLGIAWALERGAQAILLMNDDAELRPGCLAALRQALAADPTLGACAPTVVHAPPHDDRVWWGGGTFVPHKAIGVHRNAGALVQTVRSGHPPSVPQTALSGCVLLLRSQALRAAGGLRPEFFCYVEDTELSVRLVAGGWTLAWVPAAVAVHHLPYPEAPPSPWAITQRDRNRRLLARLWLTGWTRCRFVAWYYPTRLALAARYVLRGDWGRAAAIWRGLTAALPRQAP